MKTTHPRILHVAVALMSLVSSASAQSSNEVGSSLETDLYNNLSDPLPGFKSAITSYPPTIAQLQPLSAQPFFAGELGTVSSVSVYHINNGTARGTLDVVLVDDDNGIPGALIATLGIIDLESLPVRDANNDIGELITFDTPVSGLTPGGRYFIGLDQTRFVDPQEQWVASFGIINLKASEGTQGAGKVLVGPVDEWVPVSEFVTGANHRMMRVTEAPVPKLEITRAKHTAEAVALTWRSRPFKQYAVEFNATLEPSNWLVIDEWVETGGEETTFEDRNIDRLAHQQGYYRVREILPLQSDFEQDAEGWESETVSGTPWELGAVAGEPNQVWATNPNGEFLPDTVATLRSPLIDLSKVETVARLSFNYRVDTQSDEGGQLRFVDESGETILTHDNIFSGNTAEHHDNSFHWSLPKELQNRKFKIEFVFLSDGDGTVGQGWQIDNVIIR